MESKLAEAWGRWEWGGQVRMGELRGRAGVEIGGWGGEGGREGKGGREKGASTQAGGGKGAGKAEGACADPSTSRVSEQGAERQAGRAGELVMVGNQGLDHNSTLNPLPTRSLQPHPKPARSLWRLSAPA